MALNDAAEADGSRLGRTSAGSSRRFLDGELRTAASRRDRAPGPRAAGRAHARRGRCVARAAAGDHRGRAGPGRRQAGGGPDDRARGAARFRDPVARPGPGGAGAGRPARRGPPVLLHHRGRRRPDRAAGRRHPPQAPRRAGPPPRPRAPAPRGPEPGGEPDRPGQGRPAVPAVRGVPRPGPIHGAAVRGRHGPDAGRPASGRGTARSAAAEAEERNEIFPNGRRRSGTRSACSTRRRQAGSRCRSVSPCRSAGRRLRRSRAAGCTWRSARRGPGRRT